MGKEEIYEKLARLSRLLHRQQIRDIGERGPGSVPSRGQGRVIRVLEENGEMPTSALASELGVRAQTLGELIGKLEKKGLIVRRHPPADGRVVLVSLTDEAKSKEASEPGGVDALSCLTEEEQTAFEGYIDKVVSYMEEHYEPHETAAKNERHRKPHREP